VDQDKQSVTAIHQHGSEIVYHMGETIPLRAFGSDELPVARISGSQFWRRPAPREHHMNMAAQTLNLTVHGMTCANCARSVERKLAATPGVTKASVDLQATRATVEYDSDLVKPEVLANAVRSLGYEVPA
jgi:copper chaperone CopZ